MIAIANTENQEISFIRFLFHRSTNRNLLIWSTVACFILFTFYKYIYPFPSFIYDDSFVYIQTAYYNDSISDYMVGYSKFLRIFSAFTTSGLILTAFQYFLLQLSSFLLLLTASYFYNTPRSIQIILFTFIVLNPLSLVLGNLISSDCFFVSISMLWIASLLWIIHKPSTGIMIYQALLLFLAFTVRHNALMYPFITLLAFWLSELPTRKKIFWFLPGVVLCALFILYTGNRFKHLSGTWQYSPFSGWQLANNAMYAYRYVEKEERQKVPKKFEALDKMITAYFDSTRDVKRFPQEALMANTQYMWSPGLPLMVYKNIQFKRDTLSSSLKKWATVAPLYFSYGKYIIRTYPGHYLRYFLWPNANKYFAPPVEFLELHNMGWNTIPEIARIWFDYDSKNVYSRLNADKISLLGFYPILTGTINAVFFCCIFCFFLLKGWKYNKTFTKGLKFITSIWIGNAMFTIAASSAALRFQSFPIIITCVFTALLLHELWIITKMTTSPLENKQEKEMEAGLILR